MAETTFRMIADQLVLDSRPRSSSEFEALVQLALRALESTEQASELMYLTEGTNDLDLPDEVVFAAFERLLVLTENDPAVQRRFAWRLEMSGPEFDERASALRLAADQGMETAK